MYANSVIKYCSSHLKIFCVKHHFSLSCNLQISFSDTKLNLHSNYLIYWTSVMFLGDSFFSFGHDRKYESSILLIFKIFFNSIVVQLCTMFSISFQGWSFESLMRVQIRRVVTSAIWLSAWSGFVNLTAIAVWMPIPIVLVNLIIRIILIWTI